jgi:hypothetical protein
VHFARRHYRLAQAVRRALAQGPERADLSLGVMNTT